MDFKLRCNSLKCRRPLDNRAVVTTCSHIFCVQCSDDLGLSNTASNERICPACQTRLTNADDAVASQLNPSEDYKTSVLSGLSPSVIMECAGRGLAFYSYQATQEIVYQEFLAKSLTDKYTTLSSQMDQVIHDANSEIINLRNKISSAQHEHAHLQRSNDDLKQTLKTKTVALHKTQQMYDDVKKRLLQSDVQVAAADAVEDTIVAIAADGYDDSRSFLPKDARRGHQGIFEQRGLERPTQSRRSGSSGERESLRSAQQDPRLVHGSTWSSGIRAMPTAVEHRTRLPIATPQSGRGRRVDESFAAPHNAFGVGTARRPLGALSPNVVPNNASSGYGLSAGIKAGNIPMDRVQANGIRRLDRANMTMR